jgi:hypothetical protein
LGLTVPAVKTRLHRARVAVREHLREHAPAARRSMYAVPDGICNPGEAPPHL